MLDNIMDIMRARHSVRRYDGRALSDADAEAIRREVDACNAESGLDIKLVVDEPEAFTGGMTNYGKITGCRNYLVIAGPRGRDVEAGFYGERIVLLAKSLGVNSCWVALTYNTGKVKAERGKRQKKYLVVALGYGETQGHERKTKTVAEVSDYKDGDPEWYRLGIEAALLAPTAVNQQKFRFTRDGDNVTLKVSGIGFYTAIDLGIARYHFEAVSGRKCVVA